MINLPSSVLSFWVFLSFQRSFFRFHLSYFIHPYFFTARPLVHGAAPANYNHPPVPAAAVHPPQSNGTQSSSAANGTDDKSMAGKTVPGASGHPTVTPATDSHTMVGPEV
jgi:hypothetical protein